MEKAVRKAISKLQKESPNLKRRLDLKPNLLSQRLNGVGTYIPPITSLTLHYDIPGLGGGRDSTGMINYCHSQLPALSSSRPYVAMHIQQRQGPPGIIAKYNHGNTVQVNCSRKSESEIAKLIDQVCDTSGSHKYMRKGAKYPGWYVKGAGSRIDSVGESWNPLTSAMTFKP